MTKKMAYDFALAEIETFNYPVTEGNLKLPTKVPEGTYYSFYENPTTGQALCRIYIWDDGGKKRVSFVRIKNYEKLKEENPVLVNTFLENGKFLYRNTVILRKKQPEIKDGIISLFSSKMAKSPI